MASAHMAATRIRNIFGMRQESLPSPSVLRSVSTPPPPPPLPLAFNRSRLHSPVMLGELLKGVTSVDGGNSTTPPLPSGSVQPVRDVASPQPSGLFGGDSPDSNRIIFTNPLESKTPASSSENSVQKGLAGVRSISDPELHSNSRVRTKACTPDDHPDVVSVVLGMGGMGVSAGAPHSHQSSSPKGGIGNMRSLHATAEFQMEDLQDHKVKSGSGSYMEHDGISWKPVEDNKAAVHPPSDTQWRWTSKSPPATQRAIRSSNFYEAIGASDEDYVARQRHTVHAELPAPLPIDSESDQDSNGSLYQKKSIRMANELDHLKGLTESELYANQEERHHAEAPESDDDSTAITDWSVNAKYMRLKKKRQAAKVITSARSVQSPIAKDEVSNMSTDTSYSRSAAQRLHSPHLQESEWSSLPQSTAPIRDIYESQPSGKSVDNQGRARSPQRSPYGALALQSSSGSRLESPHMMTASRVISTSTFAPHHSQVHRPPSVSPVGGHNEEKYGRDCAGRGAQLLSPHLIQSGISIAPLSSHTDVSHYIDDDGGSRLHQPPRVDSEDATARATAHPPQTSHSHIGCVLSEREICSKGVERSDEPYSYFGEGQKKLEPRDMDVNIYSVSEFISNERRISTSNEDRTGPDIRQNKHVECIRVNADALKVPSDHCPASPLEHFDLDLEENKEYKEITIDYHDDPPPHMLSEDEETKGIGRLVGMFRYEDTIQSLSVKADDEIYDQSMYIQELANTLESDSDSSSTTHIRLESPIPQSYHKKGSQPAATLQNSSSISPKPHKPTSSRDLVLRNIRRNAIAALRKCDHDRDGALSFGEFSQFMQELGFFTSQEVAPPSHGISSHRSDSSRLHPSTQSTSLLTKAYSLADMLKSSMNALRKNARQPSDKPTVRSIDVKCTDMPMI